MASLSNQMTRDSTARQSSSRMLGYFQDLCHNIEFWTLDLRGVRRTGEQQTSPVYPLYPALERVCRHHGFEGEVEA